MTVTVTHSTAPDDSFSETGAAAWSANHTLSGVGTMAEQNANNVNITGGSITGVTGVGTVTGVTGTAPIASSGGTTPAISISQATTGTNGYLSSTDWNTFNNKLSTAVTSATAGTGMSVSASTGPVTFINTAPDQIVGLTGAGTTVVTGTYPNFTITSNDQFDGDVVGPASATDNAIARYDSTTGKLIQNSVVTVSDTGAIAGATTITNLDYLDFDTTYNTTLGAGQLGWNGNDTLGLGMIGGNVIQHIGEDQFFYAKATATITKGQVVMFTGAVGASGVPTGAPATGITDGNYIMGIAAENIANNGFGLIQSFGVLRNVNTSGYADGDILWYNPAVAGGLTKTKPVAPNVKAQMAAVINGGSAGGGTILIRINAGSILGGSDSNAEIGSPSNGQIITYDGQDGYWKNTDLTAGTAISIGESATGVLTVTNTAPDQTVSLTGAGTTSISGTYPNFTITSNDQYDGTVTSVSGTGTVSGLTLSGTVTSSGNLTLGGTLEVAGGSF